MNASDDVNHRAGEGEEIEPGFFRTPDPHFSETKRFFDEPMVRAAVAGAFKLLHVEHVTITRYRQPKRAWECLGRRS